MALTPTEAFGQLELAQARLMALVVNMHEGGTRSDADVDDQAAQMEDITHSLIEAWATLVLDGRAIEAMRTSIAHLGVTERAAG